MFHNILMTSLTTPLGRTDECTGWENRPFTTIWPQIQQKKTKGSEITRTIKKKKRYRTAYTTEQLWALEKTFLQTKFIDGDVRRTLSKRLNIPEKSIKVWFQNRRMKEKRSSESSDCSESCASSRSEIEPIAAEHTEVIQGTANSTSEGNFNPQPEYYPMHLEIPQPSQFTPQPIEETIYQFPDYHFNACYTNSYSTPEARAFFYDTSVYSTEYYPTGFENYGYNANAYAQQGWLDNYDMNYFN